MAWQLLLEAPDLRALSSYIQTSTAEGAETLLALCIQAILKAVDELPIHEGAHQQTSR